MSPKFCRIAATARFIPFGAIATAPPKPAPICGRGAVSVPLELQAKVPSLDALDSNKSTHPVTSAARSAPTAAIQTPLEPSRARATLQPKWSPMRVVLNAASAKDAMDPSACTASFMIETEPGSGPLSPSVGAVIAMRLPQAAIDSPNRSTSRVGGRINKLGSIIGGPDAGTAASAALSNRPVNTPPANMTPTNTPPTNTRSRKRAATSRTARLFCCIVFLLKGLKRKPTVDFTPF